MPRKEIVLQSIKPSQKSDTATGALIARAMVDILDIIETFADIKIVLEMKIAGKLELTILDFFYNTLTGENTFGKGGMAIAENKSAVAKSKAGIEVSIEGRITGSLGVDLIFFSVALKGDAGIKATAEASVELALLYANGTSTDGHLSGKTGIYLQPTYIFEGLEIKYNASLKAEIKSGTNKQDDENVNEIPKEPEHTFTAIDKIKKEGEPIFFSKQTND